MNIGDSMEKHNTIIGYPFIARKKENEYTLYDANGQTKKPYNNESLEEIVEKIVIEDLESDLAKLKKELDNCLKQYKSQELIKNVSMLGSALLTGTMGFLAYNAHVSPEIYGELTDLSLGLGTLIGGFVTVKAPSIAQSILNELNLNASTNKYFIDMLRSETSVYEYYIAYLKSHPSKGETEIPLNMNISLNKKLDNTKAVLFQLASYYEDNKDELRQLFETLEYEDLIDYFINERKLGNIEAQTLYSLIEDNYKKRISFMLQRNERTI
jgi:hypothetical protein